MTSKPASKTKLRLASIPLALVILEASPLLRASESIRRDVCELETTLTYISIIQVVKK